jgi:ABC-type multidrug transport system fused ATPase/permease subunit
MSTFLQYLTENNDFMVIGIIGPPGVGKSTIMNALYGYDGSSPGTIFIYLYVSFLHILWFVLQLEQPLVVAVVISFS